MEATLIYITEELVYDLKGRAFVMARAKADNSENPDAQNAWLMDIAQEQWPESMHQEIAGRLMELAFRECENIISSICKDVVEDGWVGSDRYKTAERRVIHLSIDNVVKEGQIKYMKALIHELIIYKVLYHWCELTAPDELEILGMRVSALEDSLKNIVKHLNQVKERPLFPF